MPDLKDLRDTREEILKAELAAWLHDVGKFTTAHLENSSDGGSFRWPCDYSYKIIVDKPTKFIKLASSAASIKKPAILNEVLNPNCISSKKAADFLPDELKQWIEAASINIKTECYNFPEILILGVPGFTTSPHRTILLDGKDGWLIALLGLSHHIAHHEKPEFKNDLVRQKYPAVRLETPFGFPFYSFDLSSPARIEDCLSKVSTPLLEPDSKKAKEALRKCFNNGWGDTRYPLNEVSLESWSLIVAALFKSQIAYFTLSKHKVYIGQWKSWKDKIIDTTASWRLLSIRTNGLEYLLSAPSIPGLKARQELLRDAWNKVQHLLEEEYPLALEVYRDENGPVFVVPDMDVLQLKDDQGTIEEQIVRAFAKGTIKQTSDFGVDVSLEREIIPHLYLDPNPWKGQPVPEELPPMGKNWKEPSKKGHLEQEAYLRSDPEWIARFWEPVRVSYMGKEYAFTEEICRVCGLKPQGWGAPDREQHYGVQARRKAGDESARCSDDCQTCKAVRRNHCYVCEKRRSNRAEMWARKAHLSPEKRKGENVLESKNVPETIWLDEVADRHGRIALLVGSFDLTHWLNGTLVRSLAVRNPENCGQNNEKCPEKSAKHVAKNPSFARLRRIWETTRRFWEETLEEAEQGLGKRPRIFLKGALQKGSLGPYHAYELEIQGRKVAVLWVPEDARDEQGNALEHRGGFWVIENLDYLDNVYGKSLEKLVRGLAGQSLNVYEPTEYGRPGQEQATFTIAGKNGVQYLEDNYTPLIPILAEPRTFMALVPADKAFEVVKAIKTKYEREMGKVRNRLPLHLGVVFADSHQPLRTILDAGRRMLNQAALPVTWKVISFTQKQTAKGDSLLSRFKGDENGQFKEWYEVSLQAADRKITWYVPAFMGDGVTEDHWYPYVFLETSSEPTDRKRYYKIDLSNPWNPEHPWLVHAGELKPDYRIYFTPATFDFIFLDHSGKRFEIAYSEAGRRLGASNRPHLLDELDDLEACWGLLTNGNRRAQDQGKPAWRLSSRQIHQIRDAIERKREEWFTSFEDSLYNDTFKRFCKDLLTNAEWRTKPSDHELNRLAQWAVKGVLTDAIELFLHIMKQRERAVDQTNEGGRRNDS